MHKILAAIICVTIAPLNLLAANGNYNSILIGDQAAGMGGAYVAMAEDPSALAFYNPATLARLKGQSFSAAVGIYKKFDTVYGENEDITAASLRVNKGFFRPLPSSTGNVIRFQNFLPNVTFALSILTPEYDNFKGQISQTSTNISTLAYTDETLWVGGAMGFELNESESFGFTTYYTARSFLRSITDRTFGASDKIYNEEKDIKENNILFIFGYLRKLNDDWTVGLSYQPKSIRVSGFGTYSDSTIETGQVTLANNFDELSTNTRIPDRLRLGFAWQALDVLKLTGEASYHGALSYQDVEEDGIAEYVRHNPIFNFAIGGELALRDWLKVRAGGYTNLSSHPNPVVGESKGIADRVDQLGFSANMALISGPIQYTFGGYYTGGKGRSVQRVNHSYQTVTKTQQVFTMLVGTSYSF